MIQLVYVSKATFGTDDENVVLNAIVDLSQARNAKLQVTGGLIYCDGYFAQLLEGSARCIDELMRSISRDDRHCELTLLGTKECQAREMPEWRLAYWGSATYIGKKIAALLNCQNEDKKERGFDSITHLIVELAA